MKQIKDQMFEMEEVDKEILEYLTKNIPNFQYT